MPTTLPFFVSYSISTDFANSFYNCYLFGKSIYKVEAKWVNTFSNFADLYTSFLFNMLSNSLAVKTLFTNIETQWTNQQYPEFAGSVATLIRIICDF